jgi:hypothetical protein
MFFALFLLLLGTFIYTVHFGFFGLVFSSFWELLFTLYTCFVLFFPYFLGKYYSHLGLFCLAFFLSLFLFLFGVPDVCSILLLAAMKLEEAGALAQVNIASQAAVPTHCNSLPRLLLASQAPSTLLGVFPRHLLSVMERHGGR